MELINRKLSLKNKVMPCFKILQFFMFFVFFITGCNQANNTDSINNNSTVDGGPNSKIRVSYEFKTYDVFLDFYLISINYNEKRYLFPTNSNHNFYFEYNFVSEGVLLSNWNEKGYKMSFPFQTLYLDFFQINSMFQEFYLI